MILPRFFQKSNFRLTKIAFRKLEARNPSSSRSPFSSGKVSEYSCY